MIDLTPEQLKAVQRILAEHAPGCEVLAFGSRVGKAPKPWSDLDLAVSGPRPLPPDALRLLGEAFEESDLPFRVDVLDLQAASPKFRKVVESRCEAVQRGEVGAKEGREGGF